MFVFLFKQKTEYEMRISDWSSDVCSADLTLIQEGYSVRLSGQDSGRGTFSQRHAVWVDQKTESKYVPLTQIGGGEFEVLDSPLSEFGVLGFEYGYALALPETLVLRSEEQTSELQSLMRISYAVFYLQKTQ